MQGIELKIPIIKKITALWLVLILTAAMCITAHAGSGIWQPDEYGWWYAFEDGGYAAGGWEYIDGCWYYFNEAGYLHTGWIRDGEAWYYLSLSGAMAVGWVYDNGSWYYLDPADGAMVSGWLPYNGAWYYMDSSGAMQTGWVYDEGDWYYMDPSGIMQTGWVYDEGDWYYMDSSGAVQTGWVYDEEEWYYLDPSGVMLTGYHIIDEQLCYLNYSGVLTDLSEVEIYTEEQKRLIETALNTPSMPEGYCSEWIDNVLDNYGIDSRAVHAVRESVYSYAFMNDLTTAEYAYDTAFNANDYWAYICTSEDLSELQPGMIVATRNSYSYMGRQFGHIGIYLGNDRIISSLGYLCIMSIWEFADTFNNEGAGSTMRWGFVPFMD